MNAYWYPVHYPQAVGVSKCDAQYFADFIAREMGICDVLSDMRNGTQTLPSLIYTTSGTPR